MPWFRCRRPFAAAAWIGIGWVVASVFLSACQPSAPPAPALTAVPVSAPLDSRMMVFDSDRGGNFEIYAIGTDGAGLRQLTSDKSYHSSWPRLSPDRRTILFYRVPSSVHPSDARQNSLWLMAADGSGLAQARPVGADGWQAQGHGEWSPDGQHIVMHGGQILNSQIFVTDATGRSPRAVTNRPGRNLDPSWSPDGNTIVFVGCASTDCPDRNLSVYTVATSGGEARRLSDNGMRSNDPYYSPDGRQIAWISETDPAATARDPGVWNILIMAADGSNQRRLTDDREVNSVPRWSRDGALVYFHRFEPRSGNPWRLFSIHSDGSNLSLVPNQGPGNNENPSI